MSRIKKSDVAESIPFNNTDTDLISENVQNAIEETFENANGPKGRLPMFFWEFNTFSNNYLYHGGQVKSNESPFVSATEGIFNEISVAGRATSANSNALWAIYRLDSASAPTSGNVMPSFGSVATIVNQGLTWEEGDFPYPGTIRVTINLVNNGPSLPLTFSEDVSLRTITVQLATNGGGSVTTTATQLRDAFRSNNTINQIWRITGTGGTLSPTSIQCSGGSVGNEIAAIHMRANGSNFRSGYDVIIDPGDILLTRCLIVDVGSIASMNVTGFVSY